ncbi:hypothetical protein RQP46_003546 [Phenoliferia psychrophenolica]
MFHHLSTFIRTITLTYASMRTSADNILWHALHNTPSPSEINFQIQCDDPDELDRIHDILFDSCSPSSLLALSIEIRYYGRDGGRTRVTMSIDEIFRKQPKLKRLTFATSNVRIRSDGPGFELTHLHLELPCLQQWVFDSLTESSRESLTHLSVEIAEGSDVPDLSPFPRLQYLKVSWTHHLADPSPFLTRISQIPLKAFVFTTTSIFSHYDDEDPDDNVAETVDVLSLLGPTLRIATLPLPPVADLKAFLLDAKKCPQLAWMELLIGEGQRWQDGQWLPSDLAFARVKNYRKVMQLYCSTFKFREPYQLLVDAEFCASVVHQKLDFQARLEDVCQGAVKPMITQCCMQALYDLGAEGQGAVDLAKGFERRKCNHFKVRPQDECMTAMAGSDNPNRYVIATQSLPLRQTLRNVPGLPIIYLARSVVLLEAPSTKTMSKKKEMEDQKLHVPASELAFLTKTSAPSTNSSALIDAGLPYASTSTLPSDAVPEKAASATTTDAKDGAPKKRKRKGPPGPNPLSVKKKKEDRPAKKPRVDLDSTRVASSAARVAGEGKRRKRGRGKKAGEGAAAGGESGAAGAGSGGDDA